MEQARQTVAECFHRGAGWAAVIGVPGVGKTLLCHRLAKELQNCFPVLLLSAGGISSRRELWQTFLFGLGQPYRGMEEGELRLALVEYLADQQSKSPGFILLVDEAHLLAGKLLEEIRILSQMPVLLGDWFRVLLAGLPVLEERVSSPRLEAVNQRIVARCYLEPWSRSETQAYIQAQLQKVSPEGDRVMLAEAAQAVFQATNGIPRLVNQLCDYALLWAWKHGHRQLDGRMVEEAWAELQQLPPPTLGASSSGIGSDLIEFGILPEDEHYQEGRPCEGEQIRSEAPALVPDSQRDSPQPCFGPEKADQQNFGSLESEKQGMAEEHTLPEEIPGEGAGLAKGRAGSLSGGGAYSSGGPEGSEHFEPAEGLHSSGPEYEFFFPSGEVTSLDPAGVRGLGQEQSPAPPMKDEYPLSAWDRLQEIEQAIYQLEESAENLPAPPSGAIEQSREMNSQEATSFENHSPAADKLVEKVSTAMGKALGRSENQTPAASNHVERDSTSRQEGLGEFEPQTSAPSNHTRSMEAVVGRFDTHPPSGGNPGLPDLVPIQGEDRSQTPPDTGAFRNASLSQSISISESQQPATATACRISPIAGPEVKTALSAPPSVQSEQQQLMFPQTGDILQYRSERRLAQDPEVEVVFERSKLSSCCGEVSRMEMDPFVEPFLEEQWIEDPYLHLDMEGQRPWSALGWGQKEPTASSKRAPNSPFAGNCPAGNQSSMPGSVSPAAKPPEPSLAQELASSGNGCSLPQAAFPSGSGGRNQPATSRPQEPPLIVIEEEILDEPIHDPKSTVIPVARHEYRRLFARLRRG